MVKDTKTGKRKETTDKEWDLRLYVAGETQKSKTAIDNLSRICEEHLKGRYHIDVVDLTKNPQLAAGEQIFAVPTLVRKLPSLYGRSSGTYLSKRKSLWGWISIRKNSEGHHDSNYKTSRGILSSFRYYLLTKIPHFLKWRNRA